MTGASLGLGMLSGMGGADAPRNIALVPFIKT